MARSIGSLTLDLIAKTGSFDQGMDRSSRRVRTTANEMEAARRAADRLVAGIAAAAAGFATAAAAMAVSSAKALDATSKMAQQIGTTTESLTGMRFAAQQFANISDQQFDMSMRRMTRRIAEAAEGSGAAKGALDAMGLSARELARLSPDKQMLAIADAMQKTERQADRLRYTMALFDTEGMALVPALQQGAEAFEANIALARQFGVVVSQEAASAAEEFMTNMNLLTEAQKGFKNQVAESVLPMLAEFSGHLVDIAKNAGDMGERVETALKVIGVAAAATATIITSRLVASILAKVGAWGAAAFAAARLQAQMTSLSAAIVGASRAVSASAGLAAGAATVLGRAGQLALGVLGGPVGLAATAVITGAAFLAMGRDSRTAATDVDELTRSLENLNRRQLESAAFNLENELAELSKQAEGHGQILQGLRNDYDALSQSQGVTEGELRNVRQAIREEEEAFESVIATIAKKSPLLAQITQRLWDLDTATRGATGSTDALNRAMGFSEAGEKYLAQIQGRIKALQDSGDPIKIASRYIAEHTELTEADRVAIMSAAHAEKALIAARDAAAKATKSGTNALNEAKRAAEAFRREQDQGLRAQFQAVSAIHQQAGALEDQVLLFGQSKTALEDLAIARLEERAAMLDGVGDSAEQIEIIEREIEARKRLRTAIGSLEQKEAERQQWEDWARDVEQIFNRVGQSLTDSIFDGAKDGKELLKDVFKGLTFNVLINPIMQAGQQWVTHNLGGMFGYQNPAQQSGGFSFGGGGAFGAGGVQMAGDWLLRSGLAPETGAKMLMNADSIATSAGNILGYGKAIWDLTEGRYGSAAGTAIGQFAGGPIGAAVGSMLGGVVDGLFDREPTTRRAQRARVDLTGGEYGITSTDDRQAGAETAIRQMAQQAVESANALMRQTGVDAAIDTFYALTESSIKGDRQGVGSGGTLRLGDQTLDFGLRESSDMTLAGFGGWSEAEMISRLAADIQISMLEAFQHVGASGELPRVLYGMIEGVFLRGLDEAQIGDLAGRFSAVIEQVGAFQVAVESLPFANLRDLSFDAAANLIQFAGGLENLDAGMTSYFQNFYSEAEQLDWLSQQLGTAFDSIGQVMPDVTQGADAAKAQFRGIVESLDITTEEGQRAYATMMTLSGSFADLVVGLEGLNPAVEEVVETVDYLGLAVEAFTRRAAGAERALQVALSGGQLADRLGGMLGMDAVYAQRREQELWATIGQGSYEQQISMSQELTELVLTRIDAEQRANQERLSTLRQELTTYRSLHSIGASLKSYLNSLESSALAPYTLGEKVSNAEAEFMRLVTDARGGDESAMRQVQGALQNALTLWRDYGASGAQYQDAYHRLTGAVGDLAGQAVSEAEAQLMQLELQAESLESISGLSETSLAQLRDLYTLTAAATDAAHEQYQTELNAADEQLQQLHLMGMDTARLHDIADLLQRLPASIAAQLQTGSMGYLASNPDLMGAFEQSGASNASAFALGHYYDYGMLEGREFNGSRGEKYLLNNPDVMAAFFEHGANATAEEFARQHYEQYGKMEGRAFARGGLATPGWALVGEGGPELVNFSQPGRVYTASQTNDILRSVNQGGNGQQVLVNEIRALRGEVAQLRQQNEALSRAQVQAVVESSRDNAKQITSGVGQAVTSRNRDDLNARNAQRKGVLA